METFDEAAKVWLSAMKLQIAPRTYKDYCVYVRTLTGFFGGMNMQEIEIQHIEKYQLERSNTVYRGKLVGPVAINHEVGNVLRQLLKRVGRWDGLEGIGRRYRPMRMPKDYEGPGRALKPVEEETIHRVFREAAENNPNLQVAALASLLSKATTMGPGEIRSLQLKNVELDADPPRLQIPLRGAKRKRRARPIVLVGEGLWCVQKLRERAERVCGCRSPEHFLIPFRPFRNRFDPNRPTAGWRYAFRELLALAGVRCRAYDFRHHAITKLLENANVSEQTAIAQAGWISPGMKERYSHTRIAALHTAANALDYKPLFVGKPVRTVEKISKRRKKQAV